MQNLNLIHIQCGSQVQTSLRGVEGAHNPCPICSLRPPPKRQEAEEFARKRGGSLLVWNEKATGFSTWRCALGHEWNQKWSAVKTGRAWCKLCSHRSRFRPKVENDLTSLRRNAQKIWVGYKRRDCQMNRNFDLTVEQIILAKQSACHYCGRRATGMDRKDNAKGHTQDNCVPSCLRCNWMRGRYISYEVMVEVGKLLQRIDP